MNILFIGDICGKPGRALVKEYLSKIKNEYKLDFVIANAENAASGRGITGKVLDELSTYGVDFFTSGDHVWNYADFIGDLQDKNLQLVRPYNYEGNSEIPGKTFEIIDLRSKGKLVIANFLAQAFMRDMVRSPFWAADDFLKELQQKNIKPGEDTIIIDFHGETTAEKINFAYYLHDKVTAVLGTHTHVATADARLIGNTAFVTDVGMVGPLDASLWQELDETLHNFRYPFKVKPKMVEKGRGIFNAVLIKSEQGKAEKITRVDFTKESI